MAEVTVWFDGSCPLCRREIAFMRRVDRGGVIDFVDVADPAFAGGVAATLPSGGACPIDREALLARFHASEDGRVVSGAEAFAAMWRAIPLLRPLGLLARNRLVLAALERLYVVFLRVRPRLQRSARALERRQGRPGRRSVRQS